MNNKEYNIIVLKKIRDILDFLKCFKISESIFWQGLFFDKGIKSEEFECGQFTISQEFSEDDGAIYDAWPEFKILVYENKIPLFFQRICEANICSYEE